MSQANADYPNTIYSTGWQMNNFCEITRRVIATIHNTKKKDSIHMITMSSHVMTPTIYFHIELQLFSNVYKKYS